MNSDRLGPVYPQHHQSGLGHRERRRAGPFHAHGGWPTPHVQSAHRASRGQAGREATPPLRLRQHCCTQLPGARHLGNPLLVSQPRLAARRLYGRRPIRWPSELPAGCLGRIRRSLRRVRPRPCQRSGPTEPRLGASCHLGPWSLNRTSRRCRGSLLANNDPLAATSHQLKRDKPSVLDRFTTRGTQPLVLRSESVVDSVKECNPPVCPLFDV